MRLVVCAVGRLRAGPHKLLIDDYVARFDRAGRALGLGPLALAEVEDRRGGGRDAEADLLARALPSPAFSIALDERGDRLSSPAFAALLAQARDAGHPVTAILIGGADGLAPGLREAADRRVSFGPMVWPHLLARVMLVEQLYRAASILAGTPYHRA